MDWNQITTLPWFWQPFHSLTFTLVAVPLVPMLLALVIGVAMFRRVSAAPISRSSPRRWRPS